MTTRDYTGTGGGSYAPGGQGGDSSSTGGGIPEQGQAKVQEMTDQARDKAQQAAGQVKGRLSEQVDQRSTQAGEQVSSTAGDLRSVAEELRNQGKDAPAKIADQVADRVEKFGSYLSDADSDRILNDVENLARRQPWAVITGGVLVGFLASRFLKASSTERSRSLGYSSGYMSTRSRDEIRSELSSSYGVAGTGYDVGVPGTIVSDYDTLPRETAVEDVTFEPTTGTEAYGGVTGVDPYSPVTDTELDDDTGSGTTRS